MAQSRRRYGLFGSGDKEDTEALLDYREDNSGLRSDLDSSKERKEETEDACYTLTVVFGLLATLLGLLFVAYWFIVRVDDGGHGPLHPAACDTIEHGYQCAPWLSHSWGQYSPYYLVPSDISSAVPDGCNVTFAQLLHRHGARFPTKGRSAQYLETITKLKAAMNVTGGVLDFLNDYKYDLGADDLTALGRQELVNSGIDFFTHYELLAETGVPFIRASQQDRVVESARHWSKGFDRARKASGKSSLVAHPYPILEISEAPGTNNTLNHGRCTAFEKVQTGQDAQTRFGEIFLPSLTAHLRELLHLRDPTILTTNDTINLLDLCPFTLAAAVASQSNPSRPRASLRSRLRDPFFSTSLSDRSDPLDFTNPEQNPFCAIFHSSVWPMYAQYQSIGKYYGYGPGAPLGPTQGVGFVNELIARLTKSPVKDTTSTNTTLDSNPLTFPLDRSIYADFSHDNDMTAIYAALGIHNNSIPPDDPSLQPESTRPYVETRNRSTKQHDTVGARVSTEAHDISRRASPKPHDTSKARALTRSEDTKSKGAPIYDAGASVPFAARLVVEKLQCSRSIGESSMIGKYVRVILNGAVMPLSQCADPGQNIDGFCRLERFIDSLAFAKSGGDWDKCFKA